MSIYRECMTSIAVAYKEFKGLHGEAFVKYYWHITHN